MRKLILSAVTLAGLSACAPQQPNALQMSAEPHPPSDSTAIGEACRGESTGSRLTGDAFYILHADISVVAGGLVQPYATLATPVTDDDQAITTLRPSEGCIGLSLRAHVRHTTLADGKTFLDYWLAVKPDAWQNEAEVNDGTLNIGALPATDLRFSQPALGSTVLHFSDAGRDFVVRLTAQPGPGAVREQLVEKSRALGGAITRGGFARAFPYEQPGLTLDDVTIGGTHSVAPRSVLPAENTVGGFGALAR